VAFRPDYTDLFIPEGSNFAARFLYLYRMMLLSLVMLFAVSTFAGAQAPVTAPESPVEANVTAILRAYPDRIETVEFRNGDWALLLNDVWYYWAEGRLLPEHLRHDWERFVAIRFYDYERGPYRLPPITPELESRLEDRTANRTLDTRIRSNEFLDDLYRIHTKGDADRLMKQITLFGLNTQVHPILVEPLERVQERLRRKAASLPDVRSYLDDLHQIHGYNWRTIAGTDRRSYHAYGVAVDLVPIGYSGWAYWQWAADAGVSRWWRLAPSERLSVPQAVIDAFEAEGFVWGGKWLFFDNIHFEYRPEVLLLSDNR
jgi:hypothetical protein